jgi:hypothetical protein
VRGKEEDILKTQIEIEALGRLDVQRSKGNFGL